MATENKEGTNLVEDTKLEINQEVAQTFGTKFKLEDVTESTDDDDDDDDDTGGDAGGAGTGSNDDDDAGNDGNRGSNEDNEEITSLADLAKSYGVEEDDELLEGLDLTDSSPKAIKEFYERRNKSLREEALKEIVESDDDVADLLQWKASGKSVDTWKALKQAETFEINIEDDDVEGHEKFVRQVYENKGIKGKKLDAIIESLKDGDELVTESKEFQEEIKAEIKKQAQDRAAQEEVSIKQARDEETRVLKEIDTIISKKGVLRNSIELPKEERETFKKFILSGEREKAWSKLSLEDSLFVDYLLWKDFKVKALSSKQSKPDTSNRKGAGIGGSKGQMDGVETISLSETLEKLRKNQNK